MDDEILMEECPVPGCDMLILAVDDKAFEFELTEHFKATPGHVEWFDETWGGILAAFNALRAFDEARAAAARRGDV